MRSLLMTKGAKKLIQTCARVKKDDSVLIVTDPNMFGIAEILAATSIAEEAETTVVIMPPRSEHGQEPPKAVAAAMRNSSVIFTPVSKSITHTSALRDAVSEGSRALVMTGFTEDMMVSGGIEADFEAMKPVCEGVANAMESSKMAKVTTVAGTSLTMSLEGRKGNALTCIVSSGQFSPVPNIEATISPVEGTAQGVIVADASVAGMGLVSSPIKTSVKNGMITSIDGGEDARKLQAILKETGDSNSYNVAELGIGLNPKSRMSGQMLEDEGVFGTVHIGIGTSITLGGKIKAALHYDLIMWRPTVELDGKVILKDESLLI